ncbi:MAG TPA: phosphate-starvation-inducible PsiE family protein [Burkholderiales bacterium]|nr:phosphate-starvation-inducible PsiE family protein [Burkholderiales bacterium]
MRTAERWKHVRGEWSVLTYYQRFESLVALVLTLLVAVIIVVALCRLSFSVIASLVFDLLDPLDQNVFQVIFGEIMTLLIALEFNHTLQYVVAREQSIIQTKVVLLIALLALARKFIILDLHDVGPGQLLGLAAITLALGIVYWFMRERDDRSRGATPGKD